jgi:hypothetical protein
LHLHIEPTNLPDGTYVLEQEADEDAGVQVNQVEVVVEETNCQPSLSEQASEGKPRSIIPYPALPCATYLLLLLVH